MCGIAFVGDQYQPVLDDETGTEPSKWCYDCIQKHLKPEQLASCAAIKDNPPPKNPKVSKGGSCYSCGDGFTQKLKQQMCSKGHLVHFKCMNRSQKKTICRKCSGQV